MMIKIRNRLTRQAGIGLLELMLSLAIIAILLVMATRYYGIASRSQRVNQGVAQVGSLEGAVATWRGSKTSYTGVTIPILGDQGLLSSAEYDGTNLYDPWGGKVGLAATSAGKGATITYTDIPGDACLAMADRMHDVKAATQRGNCTGTSFTYTIGETA